MTEHTKFYVSCEVCADYGDFKPTQYRPKIENGRVIMKCPVCGSTTGQSILVG
jgi:ribosomal protein S27E